MPAATASSRGPVPEEVLRKIREVEVRARVLADEMLVGTYRSVFKGSGLEFEEVREYEPGDEIRSIDWNVTARMGVPYIKKYREERSLNVYVAVDISASSWFGTVRQSKRELAADVGALLAVAALRNYDRASLLLFSDRIDDFIPPRVGRDHALHVIRQLLYAEGRRAPTDVAGAAHFLGNVAKKRGVVFFVSDLLDTSFEAPLRTLAQKHDVITLVLIDPRELELPSVGIVALEDAETGETVEVNTSDKRLRAAYAEAAQERRLERRRVLARMGVDSVELFTDRPYIPPLMALFRTRSRRM
ncbi:MAG: DUF58 domain-containing protein [Chloroflexota bacterium]|nr:DUF58 domain-containing protein [Chloroflexota bacterium]MDE3192115.1 DUF58 domain-containing protein [Chloroflexota bacterium]